MIELWEKSVRCTHHFISDADIEYFKPLIINVYFDAINLFKACENGTRIAGFLGVSEMKIEMLFIAPEMFGRGIGTRLLHHAVHVAGACEVDVNEQNTKAVEFYLRRGFETVARSPVDSTGRPYPLLHMRLRGNKSQE
jgi:putative acetyltransferase